MKRLLLAFSFIALFPLAVFAQEPDSAILSTPEVVTTTRTDFLVFRIVAQRAVPAIGKDWIFEVWWVDNLGNVFSDVHTGPDIPADPTATPPTDAVKNGQFYVGVFNDINFATRSARCRALDHLKTEGKIPASAVVCGG